MNNDLLFSSGIELANSVVSSGILNFSWDKVSDLKNVMNKNHEISCRDYYQQAGNFRVIAFVTSPNCTKRYLQEKELVSSSFLPLFEFLCSRFSNDFSSFSIHKATVTLFNSIYDQLRNLKSQLEDSTSPLIITGHSLGGSVAALFTLWLLENLGRPGTKQPLCITFGAPLIGDKGLQQIISQNPTWGSCFLHVAANQDFIPRLFISPEDPNANSGDANYKPFGTFFLCSESGYTCVEDPEAVFELLVATGVEGMTQNHNFNGEWRIFDYGATVGNLGSVLNLKGISRFGNVVVDTLQVGIALQLEAIGVKRTQQQRGIDLLINKMAEEEKTSILSKKDYFDSSRKLNDQKKNMAQLEWYKKHSKSTNTGYYDSYKNKTFSEDIDVVRYKKLLNRYWRKMVTEAEKKPQKEEAAFRTRWLYGGTNYRRMVEPLDIADFYREGKRDYLKNGRSQHYIRLEEWLVVAGKTPRNDSVNSRRQNVSGSLTEDSCFWAHVEGALIGCKLLKDGRGGGGDDIRDNLVKFEKYVMEQIKDYAVSPEIFLGSSSFMSWWKQYEDIVGSSYSSELIDFLRNCKFHQYADGTLLFD